eukprot:TRINITY_DN30911_c0_g1_i1.p1 TRINITY_DN30911_c0_g1~~TRINITY_DN30911_c0_g1_i1.p1  ORF type:complete len:266 (+),score=48.14 TRINITY_DN30911_c0_g1_i1:51-800(+)
MAAASVAMSRFLPGCRHIASSRRFLATSPVRQALFGGTSAPLPPTVWPDQSFIFEPPWNDTGMVKQMSHVPNMFETYFVLREARGIVSGGKDFEGVDSFNERFMDRFLTFHAEVEASQTRQLTNTKRNVKAKPQVTQFRASLASVGAVAAWSRERPPNARLWEVFPFSCQVVQARRAEHHDQGWLQVTTRFAAQEHWMLGREKDNSKTRVREHFVVFELPRTGKDEDFRVAEIHADVPPVEEPDAAKTS